MSAVIDRLEDSLVGLINALGLTLSTTSVVAVRQKTATIREGLESRQLITVSAALIPGRDRWWDTGGPGDKGQKQRQYYILVDFAAAGNRSQKSNEPTYQLWREKVMGCVEPLSGWSVDELYDVVVEPGPWIETGTHQKNLDTSKIVMRVITIEPATN